MTPALVVLNGTTAVTTSSAIAEGTETQHKNVLDLIRTYMDDLQEFGRVAFETRPFDTAGGIQQREVAMLNEQQATLLMTYMRNSDIVRAFKKRLVKAFYELAQQAAKPAELSRMDILKLAMESEQRAIALEGEKRALEAQAAVLEHKVEVLKPKAAALDAISAGTDTLTFTQTAKVLSLKRDMMTARMHAERWVFRQNGSWVAYDHHIRNGNLVYKEASYFDEKTGMTCRKPYCHVTPKGLTRLALMFGVELVLVGEAA